MSGIIFLNVHSRSVIRNTNIFRVSLKKELIPLILVRENIKSVISDESTKHIKSLKKKNLWLINK